MENPLRKRWAPYALLALAVVAVAAVFAVVALRDDGGVDPAVKSDLRDRIQAAVSQQLSAVLQVTPEEAEELYQDKELAEAAEEVGITESEILRTGQAAAQVVLDEAVEDGDISERQVENTQEIVVRALRRHL